MLLATSRLTDIGFQTMFPFPATLGLVAAGDSQVGEDPGAARYGAVGADRFAHGSGTLLTI